MRRLRSGGISQSVCVRFWRRGVDTVKKGETAEEAVSRRAIVKLWLLFLPDLEDSLFCLRKKRRRSPHPPFESRIFRQASHTARSGRPRASPPAYHKGEARKSTVCWGWKGPILPTDRSISYSFSFSFLSNEPAVPEVMGNLFKEKRNSQCESQ